MSLAVTQSDGFALAMVAILAVSFGCVLLLLLSIVRHGRRRNREVEKLLDEVERESQPPEPVHQGPDEEPPPQPWERKADWWKR